MSRDIIRERREGVCSYHGQVKTPHPCTRYSGADNKILMGVFLDQKVECHDLAKQLSHYLYFFSFSFSFLFSFGLTTRKECGQVSYDKCHISWSYVRMSQGSHHMMSVGK